MYRMTGDRGLGFEGVG